MSDTALDQANAQMASIREMAAALDVDYDRLEELRDGQDECPLSTSERQELAALEKAAGDCENREDAEQRIHEDALSVEVRSDWRVVGGDSEPSEFRIVVCTGGPHVEIRGELESGEPTRAWLQYNDWFQGMRERANDEGDSEVLLAYAGCFFFGE